MGKVSALANFSSVKTWEELRRFSSACVQDIVNQINGKVTFGDNIQGVDLSVAFPVGNTDVAVTHNLGYIPNGFFIVDIDSTGNVYRRTASTVTTIFLRASVAGTNAKIRVY